MLHVLPALRKLVLSIFSSIQCLMWPMLLVFIITYIYGILFTQVVADHMIKLDEEEREKQEVLTEYYGRLASSMLTLFQTISDGIHWGEVLEPLSKFCSPWLTL